MLRCKTVRRKVNRRRMRGHEFPEFMSWIPEEFETDLCGVEGALGAMGVPYASQIGSVAGNLGYGRHGRGLRLAGGYRR